MINSTSNSKRLTNTMNKYINEQIKSSNQSQETVLDASKDQANKKNLSQYEMNVYFKLNLIKDMQSKHHKSKKEIRQMLHPTVDENQLPKDTDR